MYAVIRTGGKQLRVAPGDIVDVEQISGDVGDKVELEDVLLVAGDGEPKLGRPTVPGAKVIASIAGEFLGPKIKIFKYKRRKRYRLRKGHRQHYTQLRIESIEV